VTKVISAKNSKPGVVQDAQLVSEQFFRSSGLAADFAAEARLGIYVHVPFCPHICPYCDFVKTAKFSRADVSGYFSALEKQYDSLIAEIPESLTTVTVYLGGGTPSLFPAAYYRPLVDKIRKRFVIEEFTIESNPFSNSERAFADWVDLGVNRITLGAQSLNPAVLSYLGRQHNSKQILANLNAARSAGLNQVQVDLIFGLKELVGQRNLRDEITELAGNGATGVSCYLLTIEESTAFAKESTATDDTVVNEYLTLIETCQALGFVQFETSNFSRNPPIHNRLYWYGLPYLGLGTGAHGLMPATSSTPFGTRYRVGELSQRKVPGDDHLPFASDSEMLFVINSSEEMRDREAMLQELLFTLLRTQDGIPLAWLEAVYEPARLARLWADARIRKACDAGYFQVENRHLRLSPAEKLRGDSWALLLISCLHASH